MSPAKFRSQSFWGSRFQYSRQHDVAYHFKLQHGFCWTLFSCTLQKEKNICIKLIRHLIMTFGMQPQLSCAMNSLYVGTCSSAVLCQVMSAPVKTSECKSSRSLVIMTWISTFYCCYAGEFVAIKNERLKVLSESSTMDKSLYLTLLLCRLRRCS